METDTIMAYNNFSELCNATPCEICGKQVLTPITRMPRHICEECAKKLNELINSKDK